MALIFDKANKPLLNRVGEATRLWLVNRPHDSPSIDENGVEQTIRRGTIDVEIATAQEFSDWLDHIKDINDYKAEANRSFVRRCFLIRFPTEFNSYSNISAELTEEWRLLREQIITDDTEFVGEAGGLFNDDEIRLDKSLTRKVKKGAGII